MTQFSFTQIYPENYNNIPTSLPFVVAASISQTHIWDSSGSVNVNKRQSDTSEAWSDVNRDTRDGNDRYDSYYRSRWPLLQMDLFQVNESEWCYCEKLICDILFSFEFFTLLIRLLLNSTVNLNQIIQTSI